MGCRPRLERVLLSDPRLCLRLFFGGNMSYVYRLHGPHSWPGARDAIMESEERVLAGMRHRVVPLVNNLKHLFLFISFFIFIFALFLRLFVFR